MVNRKKLLLLAVAILLVALAFVGPAIMPLVLVLGIVYSIIRLSAGPLCRFVARIGSSLRWKIVVAISFMAVLFFFVSLVNFRAMGYMHKELHTIQELARSEPRLVRPALDALEKTQHGLLFALTPFVTLLGALTAVGIGIALARSVMEPVRRMGEAMRRIASGDFSQAVHVENRDELGELAYRINQTATALANLQAASLATERARGLRERIAQVTLAQEEERRRLSRELHDGLGPALAAIGNRLRACQYMVRSDPQTAERELEEIRQSLKGHIQEIRQLIHELRPLALDQLGLIGALGQHVERFGQDTSIETFLSTSGGIALNPLAEVTVFRVVQECLTNVQKHAEASRVEVRLQSLDASLEVEVIDNGRGFEPRDLAATALGQGFGLSGMQERAELIGGSLSVRSRRGNGCQVTLHIPTTEVLVGAHSSPPGG